MGFLYVLLVIVCANATAVSLAGQLCDMFIYIITSLKLGIWNQQLILIEVIK